MASSDQTYRSGAAYAVERLGRLSLRDQSIDDLLQTVVELARSLVPSHPESSISLIVDGRASTPVSTGPLAVDLDEVQYETGHGPCLEAARTGEPVEVADARTDTRWRDYMISAVERGSRSSLSLPLPIGEKVAGALNLYAGEANAFDERSRAVTTEFASYAAVTAGNLLEYRNTRELADQLQRALESRAVIDNAKGILMERHKLTADQAFQALTKASMRANVKLRVVADHLVRTGVLLGS